MATLAGGQGKRGHQISLPQFYDTDCGVQAEMRIKRKGRRGMEREGGMQRRRETGGGKGGERRKWEGGRKGRAREGEGPWGRRQTADGGREGSELGHTGPQW